MNPSDDRTAQLAALDRAHVWHPFTPMRQWRETEPVIIERGEGVYLIDTLGNRYIDGVSSLWCNVHGHRVPRIDQAIREQLDRVAHSTLLGLASPPSIELAARLVKIAGKGLGTRALGRRGNQVANARAGGTADLGPSPYSLGPSLSKVFFSDAGATALEVAFKMAVGYWFHTGQPKKHKFIGFSGAYHGDTTGSMSVGYSEVFHKPYASMVFPTLFAPAPDPLRSFDGGAAEMSHLIAAHVADVDEMSALWPSELPLNAEVTRDWCLAELEKLLREHQNEIAAIVIEPIMQGAAGMICQPPGFLRGVATLATKYNTLLIADEVATGFGRTGKMFACEHEDVRPDIMCLGKGLTGGYLPLAATLCTDEIERAFRGELEERKTLYHGHTFCGNALACAAALASLDLFESTNLLERISRSTALVSKRLDVLRDPRDFPTVADVRQRGLMIGIELDPLRPRLSRPADDLPAPRPPHVVSVPPAAPTPTDDYGSPLGAALCDAMKRQGLIIRPLGNTLVLMPIPAMPEATLHRMLDIVIDTLRDQPSA